MAGLKWGEVGNRINCPFCRTCVFRNVCLNHSSGAMQFYWDPARGPLFHDFAGVPHGTFPKDFINTGAGPACGRTVHPTHPPWHPRSRSCAPGASSLAPSADGRACAAHVNIPPIALFWAPAVVRGPRPVEAPFAAAPVAVLASLNDFAYNFGHALYDFLFPVSRAAALLGHLLRLLLATETFALLWVLRLRASVRACKVPVTVWPPGRCSTCCSC